MNNTYQPNATPGTSITAGQPSPKQIIAILKDISDAEPTGANFSRLGLACYKNEKYLLAAEAYKKATELEPSNKEWQEMLQLAKGAALSEVHEPIPAITYFTREELLARPAIPAGSLPTAPTTVPVYSTSKRVKLFAGNAVGTVFTFVMTSVTTLWGKVAGYRNKVWTNWYRRPLFLGILTLAYMREKLNRNNLTSTYPKNTLVGFQPDGQTPPEGVQHFRTADGSWNNLRNPKEGAAGTRFSRNVRLDAITPETGSRLLTPNPREISRHLLTRTDGVKEVPFLNMLAAVWIQFQNHDWISHGENMLNDLIEIPMAADDPAAKKFWQTKLMVPRTQPDPTRMNEGEEARVSFINEVTHWWDGSQIYGSDRETQKRLRSGVDGKLRLTDDGTLPLNKKGIEETGFVRNWWVGLSMLHTLFAKEHNAICDHLKKSYPDWDDNRLFNVARLINAAITAKIHSVEWTPAILANQGLDMALNANWYGILTNLFKTGKHRKTVAEINVRNPELGGVVGNPINKHGAPYALSEEFVEVYRLHSLLPENLYIKKINESETKEVSVVEVRQAGSAKLTKNVSFPDLFYSFGNQHPGQLVLNNFPKFMQELSIPFNPVYDLGAVDILRARERGVPRYNEFRRQLGLNPIAKFEDLTDDVEAVKKLKAVYGSEPSAVEDLDLLIGTLAEGHRPDGFGFGETMFQIFILNATRRLQADRFYTDCYTEEYYTKEGLEWIDNADLKTILLRHYPELATTGLANIKNAFEPWDESETLDPARHPLRGWDKELKKAPWTGDAYK
ncbi:MAG TPA: peroxidase family protein [Flavisolibacter sp.]|nr:peroxidase family protein [Flavisolibacter sp.]